MMTIYEQATIWWQNNKDIEYTWEGNLASIVLG